MGLNPHATELIFLTSVPANKMELSHSTMPNVPYVHPGLNLVLQLCRPFPDCALIMLNKGINSSVKEGILMINCSWC